MPRLPPPLRLLWPYGKRIYTLLTRLLAVATIRLSPLLGGELPTATAETIDDALADNSVLSHLVAPAEEVTRMPPIGCPLDLPAFAHQLRTRFAPQTVLELPGGRVLGPQRAVVSGNGTLLNGAVRYFGTSHAREHPVFLHPRTPPRASFEATLAVLASRGDGNYYHFLHDVLPRLSVLERARNVPAPDGWYLPLTASFQRELADLIGLPRARLVDSDAKVHMRAERLLVPSLPDLDLNHPAWATAFLRDRLLPTRGELVPARRIYVTRGAGRHSRTVRNEPELLDALVPLGFDVVDPSALLVAQQIRAFAAAEVIVAPHGAALANITFASPGATVVELFAPDFVQGCYWKLATTVPGLRYRYLVGAGRTLRHRQGQGVASDIQVEVASLIRMIQGA